MNDILYYCFATDRDEKNIISRYHLVKIDTTEPDRAPLFEVTEPMSPQELSESDIRPLNMKIFNNNGIQRTELVPSAAIYPSVYCGEDKRLHLTIKAFVSRYNRYNPKRLWPSKPELMRTVTVLGETDSVREKYVDHWMTIRKITLLDKKNTQHGYYVCDFNGCISYLDIVQMQSIGNRYGFTNAKLDGNDVVLTDGSPLPKLPQPDKKWLDSLKSQCYFGKSVLDVSNDKAAQKNVRLYADTFFGYKRQNFGFEEGSPEADTAISELRSSLEAYHQMLLYFTVPKKVFGSIKQSLEHLLPEDTADNNTYKKLSRELIEQIPCRYFKQTAAFEDMMATRRTVREKLTTLQTLAEFAPRIAKQYCGIIYSELEITKLLQSMMEEYDFTLEGLKFRLKSPDSLYEKLYERPNVEGKSLEELFYETRDILRYTICFNDIDLYCEGITTIITGIMDKYGAQLNGFRNYWAPYSPGDYRSVNTSIRMPELYWDLRENRLYHDPSRKNSRYCITIPSYCVEIQFHTQESLRVKEEDNHKLYEEMRRSDTPQARKDECLRIMKENVKNIATPPDAEYLDMVSNEYITSVYDYLDLMNSELDRIREECKGSTYIDHSLLKKR